MKAKSILALLALPLLAACPDATGVPIGDAGPDGDSGCVSIAEARAMNGPVSVSLCDVTVTAVHADGFFVQAAPEGPALHVQEGALPEVAVGDVIMIAVRRISSLAGNVQVGERGPIEVRSHGADVSRLRQDLSAGTPIGEELESELVRITDAFHDGLNGPYANFEIEYGAGGSAPFCRGVYANECSEGGNVDLCLTSTFSVDAVVMQYDDGGTPGYRIHALSDADFVEVTCRETCWNDLDDDGDGLVDCNDPDCAGDPDCPCAPAPGVDPAALELCMVEYSGCECVPGCMDGFTDYLWYPEGEGPFDPEISPPAELLAVATARYTCSVCDCTEGWSLRTESGWVDTSSCQLCNSILSTGGLSRWVGGCC